MDILNNNPELQISAQAGNDDPPLRLHDHPQIKAREDYKRRRPFKDKEVIMDLSQQIISRREQIGFTRLALARAAGVNLPSIERIETGSIDGVHLDILLRIAKALDVRIQLMAND